MGPGEFERLFTTSLTGLYQDNALESGFREFTNMILNPRLAQDRMRRDAEAAGEQLPLPDIPRAEPVVEDFEPVEIGRDVDRVSAIEQPLDITVPEPDISAPPSDVSTIPGGDMFVGYGIDQIPAITSSISPVPGSYVIYYLLFFGCYVV